MHQSPSARKDARAERLALQARCRKRLRRLDLKKFNFCLGLRWPRLVLALEQNITDPANIPYRHPQHPRPKRKPGTKKVLTDSHLRLSSLQWTRSEASRLAVANSVEERKLQLDLTTVSKHAWTCESEEAAQE